MSSAREVQCVLTSFSRALVRLSGWNGTLLGRRKMKPHADEEIGRRREQTPCRCVV
jgi:hypothetical protein